jgi:uncharacterized heparinase superfamily protein
MDKHKRVLRYYRTLKYIKPSQIVWRLIRKYYQPKISLELPVIKLASQVGKVWQGSILRTKKYFEARKIHLLHESLDVSEAIWQQSRAKEKLWRYNLHYFEYLLSENPESVHAGLKLFESWLTMCPPYTEDAWEPYPLSLRIVNLIKLVFDGRGQLTPAMLDSLYLQARYLFKIPEYHLLGNHLFENAKALVFAGLFFQGQEPKRWLKLGWKLLKREITEQILDDGGHFELSPMYHVIILEGLLDLYNLCQYTGHAWPKAWTSKIQKMRHWLKVMQHPDGEIAFFNDATLGVAVNPQSIETYAMKLGLPDVASVPEGITYLPKSGYVRMQKGDAVLLADCAEVGARYLPGHAHADTLSFEFSVGKQRIFVNSGTSTYQNLTLRAYQRSTEAHNTVVVNGVNSSEVWGAFRVGKRAVPLGLQFDEAPEMLKVACAHTGYDIRAVKGCHQREWRLSTGSLEVKDLLHGNVTGTVNYYLCPRVALRATSSDQYLLAADGQKIQCHLEGAMRHTLTSASFYPGFNIVENASAIEASFSHQATMKATWCDDN